MPYYYHLIDRADVRAFQEKFGLAMSETPIILDQELYNFRYHFFIEELSEFKDACATNDMLGAADALVDLAYITHGTVLLAGLSTHTASLYDFSGTAYQSPAEPSRLHRGQWYTRYELMTWAADMFKHGSAVGSMSKTIAAVQRLEHCIYETAFCMGLPWQTLWDTVHEKNMQKIRATSATDSKRGSSFDVVKPVGWTSPDHSEALGKGPWPTFDPLSGAAGKV